MSMFARALCLSAIAALSLSLSSAAAAPVSQPLYKPDPGGPIELGRAPNSLVAGVSEGFTSGEGFGSVLVGYDSRKSSEILWNTREGIFYIGSYHAPRGPGRVTGIYSNFGVIDSKRRLVRIYQQVDHRYPISRYLRTGVEPVAMIESFDTFAILNRGSADLWLYLRDHEGRAVQAAKVPLGGDPTDLVGEDPQVRPLFISDAARDSVTVLNGFMDGSFQVKRTLPVGKDPVDLSLAQFLPDYEPEIAVVNRGSDSVTILDSPHSKDYASADYRRIGTYSAGEEPVAARAVDIDAKDGPDLAVVDAGSDRITVLLNDGHGHFHQAGSFAAGRDPVAVAAIGSFDRSFGPDLIVANHDPHTLTILLRHEPGVCRGREAQPITGTDSAEKLVGGVGIDLIRGRAGKDKIFGNASGDCLYGDGGDDFILGRTGGDLIYGGPGDDRIYGGLPEYVKTRGRDRIVGGPGRDSISAGDANDLVRAVDGERDRIDCGGGNDVAYVDLRDVVSECERVHAVAHRSR